MRHTIIILLLTCISLNLLFAQTESDDVLLTIGGNDITRGEFERIYTKNNQNPAFDKASIDEYMELFVNFKLKVYEAEALGMDTLTSFRRELLGYRMQLEKPYLTDESVDQGLIVEAYERMKFDIRASHILIKCNEDAIAKDTLAAYNKILKIRKRAIAGEDFGRLAKANSEDPSAQRNHGDLGYFTAFSMVYPFETAAYNTEVGEISDIIRTKFGYHILKVVDKKENKGKIKVAHIMRAVPQGSGNTKMDLEKEKIYQIYDSLMAGASFVKMATNFSDDRGTSQKGGELPFFGTGRMIPDFEKAAFGLQNIGDISEPVKTPYGWHIIKLLETKPLESFDELKTSIKARVSKDIRAQKGRQLVLARLKKEYNVVVNHEAIKPFYTLVDSTIRVGKWNPKKAEGYNEVMITFLDSIQITQQDFANYIGNDGLKRIPKPYSVLMDDEFSRFVDKQIINFEKDRLEEKYPEFRHLLKEYHDGILLFNLTDEMVWSKAVTDTAGLREFHEARKNNYMWGDRIEATVYTYTNADFSKAISKLAKKIAKKDLNIPEQRNVFLNKALEKDSTFALQITKQKYSKGDSDLIDGIDNAIGLKEIKEVEGKFNLVFVNANVSAEPKLLNEAKGLITADYQNYLEKQWLDELRKKYEVSINEEVLNIMIK